MPVQAVVGEVKRKWKVDVNDSQVYRARRKARSIIFGQYKEQYHQLWDYTATIRQTNQESCVLMKVDRLTTEMPPTFERMYLSLAAMRDGFKIGCRPIIGLDGCHLKGPFKGQLLSAVSRDANDNMYPITIAIVEAETKDSWTWFLETLVSDLG